MKQYNNVIVLRFDPETLRFELEEPQGRVPRDMALKILEAAENIYLGRDEEKRNVVEGAG